MNISNGGVGRGVSVGDSANDIVKVYGEPAQKDLYEYRLNPDNRNDSILFVVDESSHKIIEASILFDYMSVLNEWDMYYITD